MSACSFDRPGNKPVTRSPPGVTWEGESGRALQLGRQGQGPAASISMTSVLAPDDGPLPVISPTVATC